jgi:glycopeptide antibiotics resistance protein
MLRSTLLRRRTQTKIVHFQEHQNAGIFRTPQLNSHNLIIFGLLTDMTYKKVLKRKSSMQRNKSCSCIIVYLIMVLNIIAFKNGPY